MGDGLPSEPILLKHIVATAANPHGHFAPMNGNVQVEQSGSFNCALDAILPQLSESKRAELKDVNGLQEKMIEVIRNHPEKANEAYALGDKLAEIAPDKVISGGGALSTAAKIGMKGEAWLKNHPEIMDFINKGIDLSNIFVVLRTAPALAVLALESPVIFGAIAATTAIAYKLVHKIYDKIIEETGVNTPATQAKIASYLQSKDEDLTHDQALFLADASTALMEKIGHLAVSYGVGKCTQVFSKKLLQNEVKNNKKTENKVENRNKQGTEMNTNISDVPVTKSITQKLSKQNSKWKHTATNDGKRVYQRNDLFDLNEVSTWKVNGKTIVGTNIERMASGRAPLGKDGQSINLHHMGQGKESNLIELTKEQHTKYYKQLHINPNTIPSEIDRNAFNTWVRKYWINRAGKISDSVSK